MMNTFTIPTIVLTGGPCGGKSTVMSFLRQKLSELGYTVIVVHEAATLMKLSGITPELLGLRNFQQQLLKFIIENENRFKKAAECMMNEKTVILCDRGTMDGAAYVSPGEFDLTLRELGYSVTEMRDARYDAVIFLHSVAVDFPELFTCSNNAARGENVAEARALNERTLEAWTGHSHIHLISNNESMEQKSHRTFQVVCKILGVPVPLEIERKYLISECNLNLLPRPMEQVHIEQYYLKSKKPGSEERIRARTQKGGSVYYHTVKENIRPGVRSEIEHQITEGEYVRLLNNHDPAFGKIDKMRACFVFENQYFELDVFRKPNKLVLLEIELTEENTPVTLPEFLKNCSTDVTGKSEYSNKEIARSLAQKAV